MKLGDIIALAKSGYSVGDIKELLSLGEASPDLSQDATSGINSTPSVDTSGVTEDESAPEALPVEHTEEKPQSPDTSIIDSLKEEINQLKSDLAAAQKVNAHTDISEAGGDNYSLEDTFRNFM